MNIKDLDLNLLRLFDAVWRTRSVSLAAQQLGMSQPAASQGLARLRSVLGDALFERSGAGVRPTPRADRLAQSVQLALGTIEEALGETTEGEIIIDEPEPEPEPEHAPEGMCFCGVVHKHRDGDCAECQGPCRGHPNVYCDHVTKKICTHAPGSRSCDHTTLHDDDETSEQALEAKKRGTRKYSRDDKR